MNDPWTIVGLVVLALSLVFCAGVVAWSIGRGRSTPTPTVAVPSHDPRAYSISRALDDLKYEHADRVIGQTLGLSHAASVGSVLGPLSPAAAPKA